MMLSSTKMGTPTSSRMANTGDLMIRILGLVSFG